MKVQEGLGKGVSVRVDGGPPRMLVPPLLESKAVGWRQRVQLVAQGEAVLRYCRREALQSHVWFGIFAEMHKKTLRSHSS